MVGIAAVGVVLADSTRIIDIQDAISLAILGLAPLLCATAALPSRLRSPTAKFYELRPTKIPAPPAPLLLFIGWVGITAAAQPVAVQGYQNAVIYAIFVLAMPAAAAATTARTPERVLTAFKAAGIAAALVYLTLVVVDGPGTDIFYSARAIGGALLTAIAVAIAARAVLRTSLWPLLFMLAAVAASLSRSALAIALVLLMTFTVRGKRGSALFKSLSLSGIIGGGVLLAYQYWEPFRNRFEVGDDYAIGGITIGSSGRAALWDETIRHWELSPWFGHGLGSSEAHTLLIFRTIEHPHNDYLRLLHDFGIIGLALWVLAMLALVRGAYRRYRDSEGADRAIHLAAILLLARLSFFMVANNPIVDVFGMLATGAVVGVSVGRQALGGDPAGVARAGLLDVEAGPGGPIAALPGRTDPSRH